MEEQSKFEYLTQQSSKADQELFQKITQDIVSYRNANK